MSKVSKILVVIFSLSFGLFVYPPRIVSALGCNFNYYDPSDLNTPITPNQNMGDLSIAITSNEIRSFTYRLVLVRPDNNRPEVRDINFTTGATSTVIMKSPANGWKTGEYRLYFIEQDKIGQPQDTASCQTSFTLADIAVSSSCVATIETKPIDPNTSVILGVEDITEGDYTVYVNWQEKFSKRIKSGDKIDLGKFNVGMYPVMIKSQCGFLNTLCWSKPPRLQCNPVCFEVAQAGSGEGGQCSIEELGSINAKPCVGENCSRGGGDPCDTQDNRGAAFKTAIGCIHTNPAEFVKDLMTWVLGIGGGLAFLMMLLGAFQMLTSAGNPETLNAGRERLTSAVIGLLFIIFAMLLLQIIGFDILKIPGFGR